MSRLRKGPSGHDHIVPTLDDIADGLFVRRVGDDFVGATAAGPYPFLDITPTAHAGVPYLEGRLWYDLEHHCLSCYDDETGTILEIGQEVRYRARNVTASTILDTSAVYISGAVTDTPTIGLADASQPPPISYFAGVATQNIPKNDTGWITVLGIVHDYDTRSFAAGDFLWLSDSVPGGLRNTPPSVGTALVRFAAIALNSRLDGSVLVHLLGPGYISRQADVDDGLPTPAGRLLAANGTHWTATTALHLEGTGSPEGAVAAPLGSTYRNLSGGAGTTFYVKESGATGNTGWTAK